MTRSFCKTNHVNYKMANQILNGVVYLKRNLMAEAKCMLIVMPPNIIERRESVRVNETEAPNKIQERRPSVPANISSFASTSSTAHLSREEWLERLNLPGIANLDKELKDSSKARKSPLFKKPFHITGRRPSKSNFFISILY